MGRAGVEPYIENVIDLLPLSRILDQAGEEALTRALLEPGVGALFAEGIDDAVDQLGGGIEVAGRDHAARLLVAEHGDGHAPGALARHHPIGSRLDHAANAVLALRRHPARVADGFEGTISERTAAIDLVIHRDEPLRRVAEDHRLLRSPGMRIVVAEPPACNE